MAPEPQQDEGDLDRPVPKASLTNEAFSWQRRRFWLLTPLAFGVVALLLGALLWRSFRAEPEAAPTLDVEAALTEFMEAATPAPAISAQVYQAAIPSFVVIQTKHDDPEDEEGFGIGSGVVINSDAEVLTALHIVETATEIEILFADGTRSPAIIANAEPDTDIAVLTPLVPPEMVLPGTIGNASAMRVGDEVFAIGNPLGLVASLSAGVVSGLGRDFNPVGRDEPIEGLIQFDAAVNQGSSGGPLLNRRGQVVGIVTGLINPTEQESFVGIGFAVPISDAASAAGGPAQ